MCHYFCSNQPQEGQMEPKNRDNKVRNLTYFLFFNRSHLQSLAAFLGQRSQCVPLVTNPLAASVHTGGVVVVQLTGAQTDEETRESLELPASQQFALFTWFLFTLIFL